MNQLNTDILLITEAEPTRVYKNKTFWNSNSTEANAFPSKEFHRKALLFNNTIGLSHTNPIIMHKRTASKDSIMTNNYVLIPKFNDLRLSNSLKKNNVPKENKAFIKGEGKDSQQNMLLIAGDIVMKPTNAFANLQNSSLKYKIKKEDIPRIKPLPPQMKTPIININQNINHNIHINVNSPSGKITLNPINFKNIKITRQDNSSSPLNDAIDAKSIPITINELNKKGSSSIESEESMPISLQNSFLTKKSNDSIKNTKISNTLVSNMSLLKEQDTLISYNISDDESDNPPPLRKSLFKDQKQSQNVVIDKEAFRQFCIDLDKKLSLIK